MLATRRWVTRWSSGFGAVSRLEVQYKTLPHPKQYGQAAADLGALAGGIGVLLDQITGEEPGEIGDAAGVAASARGEYVGAGLAEVRENFVAPEEVDHFDGVGFAGIGLFERGAEDIDREMDLDDFDFLPGRRGPAHFVGRLGMGDEHRAGLDFARDPGAANVALAQRGRAFGVAQTFNTGHSQSARRFL